MNFQKAESEKDRIYQAGIDRTQDYMNKYFQSLQRKYLMKKYFNKWRQKIKS